MNETVNTADINKSAEIGKASDYSVITGANLNCAPYFFGLCTTLRIKQGPAGSGYTQTTLVRIILCNKNMNCLTFIGIKIVNRSHFKLCAVNININTAKSCNNAVFDNVSDLNRHRGLIFVGIFNLRLILAKI